MNNNINTQTPIVSINIHCHFSRIRDLLSALSQKEWDTLEAFADNRLKRLRETGRLRNHFAQYSPADLVQEAFSCVLKGKACDSVARFPYPVSDRYDLQNWICQIIEHLAHRLASTEEGRCDTVNDPNLSLLKESDLQRLP